jgi:hypothetical protein
MGGDPLSIAIACVSLLNGIATLSKQLVTFVNAVRGTRKDVEGFSKELESLKIAVSRLSDNQINIPDVVKQDVVRILAQCNAITEDMQAIVRKHLNSKAGRKLQWTISDSDEVSRLRQRLEPHKTGLQIALSAAIIHQNNSLKADTFALQEAAAASIAELAALRKEVAELRRALDAAPNPMLQRYLEEATEYADSLADPFEDPGLPSEDGNAKLSTPKGTSERPKLPSPTDDGYQVPESTSFPRDGRKLKPQYAETIQEKSTQVLLVESYEHRHLDHYFSPISTEYFDRKLKDFADARGMIFVDVSVMAMETAKLDERTFVRIHVLERYLGVQDKRLALLDYISVPEYPFARRLPRIPEIRFLLKDGVDVNARIEVGREPYPPVLLGGTILHALAYDGLGIRLLPILVKAGIDLNART